MNRRFHRYSIILWLLVLLATASTLLAADAEYIWAENDFSGSTLYMSSYRNGSWGKKELIFSDDNLNILPALGSDSRGNHLAVWVTLKADGRSVLKYSWQEDNGWTAPSILWDEFKDNLAPVILFDAVDTPWVIWSANNGDDDDIYAVSSTNERWSFPVKLHADNAVPDILPRARLDSSGEIIVSWQQLGKDDLYRQMTAVLGAGGRYVKSLMRAKSKTRKMLVTRKDAEIPLPPFEANSRSTLYFPGRRELQSTVIRKRIDQ